MVPSMRQHKENLKREKGTFRATHAGKKTGTGVLQTSKSNEEACNKVGNGSKEGVWNANQPQGTTRVSKNILLKTKITGDEKTNPFARSNKNPTGNANYERHRKGGVTCGGGGEDSMIGGNEKALKDVPPTANGYSKRGTKLETHPGKKDRQPSETRRKA